MKKNKKILIIIISIICLIIVGCIIYYYVFARNYKMTVYQYMLDDKMVFSEKLLDNGINTGTYKINCNSKCSLITNEFAYNFFGVSNEKEGYIYDLSNNEIYNVGYFNGFSILTHKNKDDNYSNIGVILNRKNDNNFSNSFFNINLKKTTISWTKDYIIGINMISDTIVDTVNTPIFIDITNGKVYELDNYSNYKCYTPNTCVFYEESGYGFIYNFRLGNKYLINYNVVIDYLGGAIVLKDNKYIDVKFSNNSTTSIIDNINYKDIVVGNSYSNNKLKTNEILLSFLVDKSINNCPTTIYNTATKEIVNYNDCSYFK